MTDAELREIARAIVDASGDLFQDLCKTLEVYVPAGSLADMTPSVARQFRIKGHDRDLRLTLSLDWADEEA